MIKVSMMDLVERNLSHYKILLNEVQQKLNELLKKLEKVLEHFDILLILLGVIKI